MATLSASGFLRLPKNGYTIVFIHGILSSSETAWTSKDGINWPQLVLDEPGLVECGVYRFNYRADFFSGNFSISDAADLLEESLGDIRATGAPKGIVFVCHSLGGVVARRFLVTRKGELKKVSIGLFMVASPSLGASYANYASTLLFFLRNVQIDGLKLADSNPWLRDLDTDFRNLLDSGDLRIVGRELVEDELENAKWLSNAQIVPWTSAARNFAKPLKLPHTNHSSIAKPENSAARQHIALVRFVDAFVRLGRRRTRRASLSSSDDQATASPVVILSREDGRKPVSRTNQWLALGGVAVLVAATAFFLRTPIVDLTRNADFTRVGCPTGVRSDTVVLEDRYDVLVNLFSERIYQRETIRRPDQQVTAFDLNKEGEPRVLPSPIGPYAPEWVKERFPFTIRDGTIRIRWVWTNTHGDSKEGISVPPGWRIRTFVTNYRMPSGVVPDVVERTPDSCRYEAPDSFRCENIWQTGDIRIVWKWSVWDSCLAK